MVYVLCFGLFQIQLLYENFMEHNILGEFKVVHSTH
jgi:hypothetical protein